MPTLNEERIIRAQQESGFTGPATLNELAIRAIKTVDPGATGTLCEIEHQAWDDILIPPGKWNDRACAEYVRAGLSGSLNEMQWAYYQIDPPVFVGPTIDNILAIDGAVLTPIDVSDRFDGSQLQYALVGTWPPGVTISSAGVISGTVGGGAATYSGCRIQATNVTGTAQSNAFDVDVSAPG